MNLQWTGPANDCLDLREPGSLKLHGWVVGLKTGEYLAHPRFEYGNNQVFGTLEEAKRYVETLVRISQ